MEIGNDLPEVVYVARVHRDELARSASWPALAIDGGEHAEVGSELERRARFSERRRRNGKHDMRGRGDRGNVDLPALRRQGGTGRTAVHPDARAVGDPGFREHPAQGVDEVTLLHGATGVGFEEFAIDRGVLQQLCTSFHVLPLSLRTRPDKRDDPDAVSFAFAYLSTTTRRNHPCDRSSSC